MEFIRQNQFYVAMIAIVVLYLFGQRYFIRGLIGGAVK
jgi:ABC-type glycerol-3-phosphate transport system permease component